jgi:hypothetical protein
VLFSIGTGHVAEGSLIREGSEFSQWNLAFGKRVRGKAAA